MRLHRGITALTSDTGWSGRNTGNYTLRFPAAIRAGFFLPMALRLTVIAGLMLLLSLVAAVSVSAHALLVRSTPSAGDRLSKPPTTVDLWFSEPLDRSFSRAEVRDQLGQRVDEGRVEFNPADPTQMSVGLRPLKAGIYVVSWRTLSTVDGHQWTGSFPFIILNPDGSVPEGSVSVEAAKSEVPAPTATTVRWLELVSGVLLLGGLAFALIVAFPATRALPSPALAAVAPQLRRQALRWAAAAALAFIVTSFLNAVLQARDLGGLGVLPDFLFRSRPGHLWLLRTGLTVGILALVGFGWTGPALRLGQLVPASVLAAIAAFLLAAGGYGWIVVVFALAVLALTAYRLSRNQTPATLLTGLLPVWAAFIMACVALLTMSLTSHAGAVSPGSFWATLADYSHLLAASIWVGGLISLPFLWGMARAIEGFDRTRFLARAVARFSPLAALSVAIIVASGIFSALVEVPSWAALVETTYGRALLVKLALVVLMLAVGGLNAFVVRPRLERSAGIAGSGQTAVPAVAEVWRRRLFVTVLIEGALGIFILASVGVLTKTPPSRAALAASAAQPQVEEQGAFEETVIADDLQVTLTITPNRAGINQYRVRMSGAAPQEIQRVRLTFLTTDQRFGGSSGVAEASGAGTWTLEGPYFTFGGPWQVFVDIRRVGRDDVTAGYRPLVAGPLPPKAGPSPSAFALPEISIDFNLLAGAYAVAAGVGILWWRRSQSGAGRISSLAFAAGALAVLGGAVLLVGRPVPLQSAVESSRRVEATEQSLARGAELFGQNCAQCHGAGGKGDGPLAPTLNPRPVDLTRHVPFHPDEQLYSWISEGIPGTAMPAFKAYLSEEDRWHILNYLRELATPQTR